MESSKHKYPLSGFDEEAVSAPSAVPRTLQHILDNIDDNSSDSEPAAELKSYDNEPSEIFGTEATIKCLYEGDESYYGSINWQETPPDKFSKHQKRWKDPALLLRYAKPLKTGSANVHSIVLQSPQLKTFASQVLNKYPGLDIDSDFPTFKAPFEPFFHKWEEVNHFRDACQEPTDRKHMDLLYGVLKSELESSFRGLDRLLPQKKIKFNLLWAIFPPGSLAIQLEGENTRCSIVKSTEIDYCGNFKLDLTFLDHDGKSYGWESTSTTIKFFDGVRPVDEIGIIPHKCLDNATEHMERLQERGRRSTEILQNMYHSYEGFIQARWGLPEFVEGRIMVDPLEYSRSSRISFTVENYPVGLRELVPKEVGFLEEPMLRQHPFSSTPSDPFRAPEEPAIHAPARDLLKQHRWTQQIWGIAPETLLSPIVRGYCLTSKQWTEFKVDNISEVAWNDKAFDMLVLPPPRKRLLKALVEEQKKHKIETDDVVRGKGQGLILFLCGPPGTGKTLTAESIADCLRLPLYALSASQLGEDLDDIEEGLNRILRLAGIWDAVLLLDEADVFLERRSDEPNSRNRNKRVAALLRVLEYYKGILILTANRPIELDEALYSRFHLFLRYKALSYEARKDVWANFLRAASDQINEDYLDVLAMEDMNGRQIKNVVKMARLLATNEQASLTISHLQDVIKIVKENG